MTVASRHQGRQGDGPPAEEPGLSRAQATYEQLRFAIVRGKIRPNERLIELDLAREFNVSRTPIRESLQRLAAEGLVAPARRGWVVRELTLDEIREIYEVRQTLEGFAARLAAERATDEQLAVVKELVDRRPPATPTERSDLVFNNDEFHEAILRSCGNERLIEQINKNNDYYFNIQVATLYSEQQLAASAKQHRDLAAALLRRDGDAAEQIMRAHIRDALAVIMFHAR